MLLRELMQDHGEFLFRRRGTLPFLLMPLAFLAVAQGNSVERWFGEGGESAWDLVSLVVAFSGLLVRAVTVGCAPRGTSGRNTRSQVAETLNTTGFYSVTQNPLYLGNFLVILGIVLDFKVMWLVLVVAAAFALYYERIVGAEASFLERTFGDRYVEWARRTPVFFPKFRLWQKADLPFSLRNVLRREYNGFLVIVVSFVVAAFSEDLLAEGVSAGRWFREDYLWVVFLCFGAAVWFSLRGLKKYTRVLDVAGR